MDKYEGTNKPTVTLSVNDTLIRSLTPSSQEPLPAEVSSAPVEETTAPNEASVAPTQAGGKKKGVSRIASFFIRGAVSALLLGFLFLPKLLPYKGSEKVTEAAKTIVMSDITRSSDVGEGKIVEIIRKIIQDIGSNESEDEKEE